MIAMNLEHICDVAVKVAKPFEIGDVGTGERRIINIDGGTISGPKFNGRVLPGGADFQIIRPNGFTILEARYAIEADDGALVYVENNGVRFGSPEVMANGPVTDAVAYETENASGPTDPTRAKYVVSTSAVFLSSLRVAMNATAPAMSASKMTSDDNVRRRIFIVPPGNVRRPLPTD